MGTAKVITRTTAMVLPCSNTGYVPWDLGITLSAIARRAHVRMCAQDTMGAPSRAVMESPVWMAPAPPLLRNDTVIRYASLARAQGDDQSLSHGSLAH